MSRGNDRRNLPRGEAESRPHHCAIGFPPLPPTAPNDIPFIVSVHVRSAVSAQEGSCLTRYL
jgi:hypothetical protein